MSEPSGDHRNWDPLEVHQRRARMASIVQTYVLELRGFEDFFPSEGEQIRVDGLPAGQPDDIFRFLVVLAEAQLVPGLLRSRRPERCLEGLRDRKRSSRLLGLRWTLDDVAANRDAGVSDF